MGQCNGINPPDYRTNLTESKPTGGNVGSNYLDNLDPYVIDQKKRAAFQECLTREGGQTNWGQYKSYDEILTKVDNITQGCASQTYK